jgi:hypothetical protein
MPLERRERAFQGFDPLTLPKTRLEAARRGVRRASREVERNTVQTVAHANTEPIAPVRGFERESPCP